MKKRSASQTPSKRIAAKSKKKQPAAVLPDPPTAAGIKKSRLAVLQRDQKIVPTVPHLVTDAPPGSLSEPTIFWFERFTEWLQQKSPRSVLVLYKRERERQGAIRRDKKPLTQVKTLPSSWATAKKTYRWRERAEAWDAVEQERKNQEWAPTREGERHEELRRAAELRKRARELLALPVLTEEIKRDRDGVPIAWLLIPEFRAFKTASDLLGQAKNHARAALQMPDRFDRQELVGKNGGPVEMGDGGLTPEERLGRLLALVKQVTATHSGETEEDDHEPIVQEISWRDVH